MLNLVKMRDFRDEVLTAAAPVLVAWVRRDGDFSSLGEILESVSENCEGKIKICLFEEGEGDFFRKEYHVMGTPTFLLFEKGREAGRLLGKADEEALEGFIGRTLDTGP